MYFCCYLGLTALVLVLLLFILFVLKADADVQLLFCEKFLGKRNLSGKVIWITGASSGIGEYLAYDCARSGARLIISGVNTERLENVKRNCAKIIAQSYVLALPQSDVLALPFSIEDYSVHEGLVQKVIEHFGHIDILVNNAGISQKAGFADIDIEVDKKLFAVNVFGTVNLTRKVLKHFLERKVGQIAVCSSMAGKVGAPLSSSYTGSKHALHGYFECLRTEMGCSNISVTLICPGPVFSGLRSRCVTGNVGEIHNEEAPPSAKKMKTDRCSELMAVAIANKLDECWICLQPLLMMYYVAQYAPSVFHFLISNFFSAEKATALRSGHN